MHLILYRYIVKTCAKQNQKYDYDNASVNYRRFGGIKAAYLIPKGIVAGFFINLSHNYLASDKFTEIP